MVVGVSYHPGGRDSLRWLAFWRQILPPIHAYASGQQKVGGRPDAVQQHQAQRQEGEEARYQQLQVEEPQDDEGSLKRLGAGDRQTLGKAFGCREA